ncbi:hypothetical protein GIX10_09535 [Acinetobacter sp. YIM 103518]|uniref:Capsular biosynthesis protein n=1 Tax=Acinetobacter faecalis TaxID=2665161 RepID=A0A6L6GGJ7_9GAMM|nr:capsular biosynthesis protein [Acinetobacter faecalis]MTD11665.1 hypothetical protein [Acinetobacter faecalis]
MSQHVKHLLTSKRVLLLQGPMGDYFSKLAVWLKKNGIECFKLNFNAGDHYFYKKVNNVFDYKGKITDFSEWLDIFLIEKQIDTIICFGDCRAYHRLAKELAVLNNINFFAFEEGYIRPNYITFEQEGVNFFSHFLLHLKNRKDLDAIDLKEIYDVQNSPAKLKKSVAIYYLMWVLFAWEYPYYQHHRGIKPLKELGCWILSELRHLKNKFIEIRHFENFLSNNSKNYFVFALQVHNDFQIRVHSDLQAMEKYIELVLDNFSQYANISTHLVIKHHPMDRGYRNYKKLIYKKAKELKVESRVHYYCDIHLPTLLKHSLGLVTVNSTTGIQALFHKIPVKVLGRAIYNLPRLTNQYDLEKFWIQPGDVDYEYFKFFRTELIQYSQLNGSFYGLSPWMNEYQKVDSLDASVELLKS